MKDFFTCFKKIRIRETFDKKSNLLEIINRIGYIQLIQFRKQQHRMCLPFYIKNYIIFIINLKIILNMILR